MLMAVAALLLFSACDKNGFSYEDVADGGNVQYTILDTLTIQMRTVQLDSIATSATGTALIGSYTDPYFGKASAATYFRLALPPVREVATKAVYDSIELIMKPTGSYYGDTLPQQRFSIYQLTQKLVLPENYTALFSHQTFAASSIPLADVTIPVRPNNGDSIHFRLNDTKGRELFDLLKNKAQEVSSDDFFTEYFKGMTVRGGINNSAVLSFQARDSALFIRLHYHVTTTDIEERFFDFQMTASELQYNAITSDKSGTPLEHLAAGASGLPSSATGNRLFVQSITRTVTRMDFTSVPSLPELSKYGRIMRAELILRPVAGTYRDFKLPPALTLCPADNKNYVVPGDTLSSSAGYQYGTLFTDYLNPENTRYTYDVTDYCRSLIGTDSYSYRGLLVIPTTGDYETKFNRLIMGDGKNAESKAQLRIYYLLYK